MTVKSMGSEGEARLAAEMSEVGEPQRRVCEMRRVAGSGWPRVMVLGWSEGKVRSREAVCRMCVCGMDTVMTMRRGGLDEGGAHVGEGVEEVVFGRCTVLWFWVLMSVLW